MDTEGLPVTLRPTAAPDFPAIRSLIYRVRINPMGLKWPNFIVAVDSQGRIIGCGQIKHHGDGSLELASIAVEEDWRRRGIAAAIIERLIEGRSGPIYLTAQTGLHSYYARFGFRTAQAHELTPYFKRLESLVWLFRLLRLMPEEGLVFMLRESEPAAPPTGSAPSPPA